MAKLFNRAKMTTTTTGSGTITLGSASNGFQSFADAGVADGDVVQYVIEEGANFEIGTGTYSATGTSLTRTPSESSNSDAAITLAGQATVSITAVADDLNRLQHNGTDKVTVSSSGASVSGNLAVSGTVDGVDVSARDAVLTSTTSTANAALPKAGGTMTGDLVLAQGTVTGKLDRHALHIGGNGLASADASIYIGNDGDGGGYGWELFYKGSGSSNNNEFILKSENLGSAVDALKVKQDGKSYFANELYASSNQRVFADNYHPNADKWTTSRTLSLTGGVTGSVSWDGSANASLTSTVALATASAVGGIKIGYAENGKNYPVELDSNGKAYVNVPWTDTNTNTNQLTTFVVQDGDSTNVTMGQGKYLKFKEGGAIDVNFTDTNGGTSGDPYDLQISHADTSSQGSVNNSNGTVIQDVTLDGYGHVTGLGSVNLDSRYVNTSGDTMTGALSMSGNPINDTLLGYHSLGATQGANPYPYRYYRITSDLTFDDNRGYEVFIDGDDNHGYASLSHIWISSHSNSGNLDRVRMTYVSGEKRMLEVILASDEHVWIRSTAKWGNIRIRALYANEDVSAMPYATLEAEPANAQFTEIEDFEWNGDNNTKTVEKNWHSNNDGAGSGLDADTLDGQHASAFLTAHPNISAASSSNNSGRTYIQDITVDSNGHVTGIATATETVTNTNTNQLTTFQLEDGDGTEVTIRHGKEVKFREAGGININWTDTSHGSDGDPYDLSFNVTSAPFLTEDDSVTYGTSGLQWFDVSGNGGPNGNNATPSNPTNDWYHHILANHGNNGGYYVDIAQSFHSDAVYHRRLTNGTLSSWQRFYTDAYHPEVDNADTVDGIHAASFLRSDANDTGTGQYTLTNKKQIIGSSSNWDAVGFSKQTNLHFQGHNQFWVGAGNGTWFTGTANTKSQASGLAADAAKAHDLLITTMQSTNDHDRGITFAVDNTGAGTSGWRLGKWHSGDARDSSKLAIDGGLVVHGGYTDHYDYYGNDYSTYYSHRGGAAFWTGDSGWNDPSITAAHAIQIQSGNAGTNAQNPALQFHQYGYGGVQFRYDGPNDRMYLESTSSNRFDYFRIKTDHGYIDFGPANSSHAHINTDRSNFYFNKQLQVDTGIVRSYNEDLNLNRAGSTSARLRLTSGTTYSDQKFHVGDDAGIHIQTDTNAAGAKITMSDNSPSGGQFGTIEYRHADSQSFGAGNCFKFFGSEPSMSFHVAGNGLFTGNVATAYSDERLKDFDGKIEGALDKLSQLNGYYYHANDTAVELGYDKEPRQVGVSAQEVEAVLPEVIAPAAIDPEYKTVHYDRLVPLLIEAIKELKAEVEELKRQ